MVQEDIGRSGFWLLEGVRVDDELCAGSGIGHCGSIK